MELYDSPASGNAYKVRLLASLLGVQLELNPIDLMAGENRTEAFLARNPRGQIPVLVDGDAIIWESQAILTHLARRHGPDWLPEDTESLVAVMQWLAVAGNELLYGLARARAVNRFARPWNMTQSQDLGRSGLATMDARLDGRTWLATDVPTIADIACYPYVALAPEGDIPLDPYPHVRAWIAAIQALPGYIGMPGID